VLGALVLLGTAVRLLYGIRSQGWLGSPDHLAWTTLLAEAAAGPIRFDQLLYYGHEGADPLLALIALLVGWVPGSVPALAWSGLLVDTLSRGIQVGAALALFGPRTALWFGAWTVFAVPGLLPWPTTHYGLHGLSSFWPIVLLLVAGRRGVTPSPVGVGAVIGLAVAWSFDSIVLIPVVFVLSYQRWRTDGAAWVLKCLATLTLVVTPFLIVRSMLSAGFLLEGLGALSIRGESLWGARLLATPLRIVLAIGFTLPGASQLNGLGDAVSMQLSRWLWMAACVSGVWLAVRTQRADRAIHAGVFVLACYLVFYAASPFFTASLGQDHFLAYRHLSYVIPLMVLLGIHGLTTNTKAWTKIGVFLVALGTVESAVATVRATPVPSPSYREAGWELGRKLGHDPERLMRLLDLAPSDTRENFAFGYGWALTGILLDGVATTDHASFTRLIGLIDRFPPPDRESVVRGAIAAFNPAFTPRLEPSMLPALRDAIDR
jgi:hypothetical protein